MSWRVRLNEHFSGGNGALGGGLFVRSTGDEDVSENPPEVYTDVAPPISSERFTEFPFVDGTLTITRASDGHEYVESTDFEESAPDSWTNLTIVAGTPIVVHYFIDSSLQGGGGDGGGEVVFNDRGEFDVGSIYMKWDLVDYGGSSWIVRVDDLSGVTPSEAESTYYMLLAGPGPQGDEGDVGPEGDSAYEVAVAEGYGGTEVEWLNSLRGADGFTVRVRSNGSLMPLRASMNFRSGFTLADDIVNDRINIDASGAGGGGSASYTSLVKLGVI